MKRRTSALSVSAAAVVVAAPLLTACGGDSHQGAAAVVGGEKITVSQIQHEVETVREAQRTQENADDLIADSGSLSQETVARLVIEKLVEHAAEQQNVSVEPRQVQEIIGEFESQFPDQEEMARYLLNTEATTLDQLEELFRTQLLINGLSEEVGPENLTQVVAWTAENVGVEINPRYGEWNNDMAVIEPASMPWLTDGTTEDEDEYGQLPPGGTQP